MLNQERTKEMDNNPIRGVVARVEGLFESLLSESFGT